VGRDTSVGEVNSAAKKLNSAIKRYLKVGDQEPPTEDSEWTAFFDDGQALLSEAQTRYETWSKLLDESIADGHKPPGYKRLVRYRTAMGVWLDDQFEQAQLSRECFFTAGSLANKDDAMACYATMLSDNGPRWQKNTTRLAALGSGLRQ
jgi:hypothetical protein